MVGGIGEDELEINLEQLKPGQMGINFIDTVMDSWEFTAPKDGYGNLLIMKKEIVKASIN
jgi:hypothetical protein